MKRLLRSGRNVERVTAVPALVVVEYLFIELATDSVAGRAARGTAQQHAHEAASQTANDGADGASNQAQGCAGFSTGKHGGGTACCACDRANGAAGLAAVVAGGGVVGVTVGAGKGRGHISLGVG